MKKLAILFLLMGVLFLLVKLKSSREYDKTARKYCACASASASYVDSTLEIKNHNNLDSLYKESTIPDSVSKDLTQLKKWAAMSIVVQQICAKNIDKPYFTFIFFRPSKEEFQEKLKIRVKKECPELRDELRKFLGPKK